MDQISGNNNDESLGCGYLANLHQSEKENLVDFSLVKKYKILCIALKELYDSKVWPTKYKREFNYLLIFCLDSSPLPLCAMKKDTVLRSR